jgi:hypothetical protein
MIKIIEAFSAEELEQKTNEFMRKVGYNCPVRDSMVLIQDGRLLRQAVIFYDEELSDHEEPINESAPPVQTNGNVTSEPDRGALWLQKNGTITGNWKGKKVSLSEPEAKFLVDNGNIELSLGDDEVYILTSKFKKTSKYPDFIILPRKKYPATFKKAGE